MEFELDDLRGKVIFRLVNTKANENFLKEAVHEEFLDLSIVYGIKLSDMVVTVSNELAETLGLTKEMLHEYAKDCSTLMPPKIEEFGKAFHERLDEQTGEQMEELDDEMKRDLEERLACGCDGKYPLVVSNESGFYGAGVILYPGVLKHLAESLDSDLYLTPSSVHEFFVMPTGIFSIDTMLESVAECNKENNPDEVLSDRLYMYSRETNRLGSFARITNSEKEEADGKR